MNDLVDVVLHQLSAVILHNHLNIEGLTLPVQLFKLILHFMRQFDDIGLGIVDYLQGDCIFSIHPADGLFLFLSIIDLCNILQFHRVVPPSDDQLLDLVDVVIFCI